MLENKTTGATHAPARSAAIAPMLKARIRVPRLWSCARNPLEKREKSITSRSNIARPRTMKRAAIPRLNHGDELMVPNVPAVKMTMSPRTPYTSAMAAP